MTQRALIPIPGPDHAFRKGLWATAAATALTCHLAVAAFAITHMREDPDDDDLGAPGVEVTFELASAQAQPSELPPGPESEASAAAAPVQVQKATEKEVELPRETPVESRQPDRLVTVENPKPLQEDEPELSTHNALPSEASVAQEATASTAVQNAPEAPKSTTRDQGSGESRQRTRVTWQKELGAHLAKYKRYPENRSQTDAEIVVTMSLDRSGHVLAVNVNRSSGDSAFDHAAVAMVERASPVPAPPPLVADEGLTFSLPVVFRKSKQ